MDKRKKAGRGILLCLVVIMMLALTACGDGKRIVLTTGFGEHEVFRVDNLSCYDYEVMIYLANIYNQYSMVYGEEIWQSQVEGVSLEENVRQTVLARIAKIKMMNLLAAHYNLELTEEEQDMAARCAREYYNTLSEEEIAFFGGIKEDELQEMYEEYALAHKVYEFLVSDVNPEVSDDEARTVTVKEIIIPTVYEGADGAMVAYSPAEQQEAYELALEVLELARAGEDFDSLMISYGASESGTYSFRREECEAALADAVFALGEDEISEVLQGGTAYYIFYCVSPFDRDETEVAKTEIVRQRRREAFERVYGIFKEENECYLNETLWAEIHFSGNPEVDTANFFDIFEVYYGTAEY
ncbi:MAG: peptidylprolyl isomerase [Lachnospiraceae bacterium]|nr:peptidylprolyl isomerase [Lachnospiraceae bacterium]